MPPSTPRVVQRQEPNGCPTLSCADPPRRVPGAPLVPIQQPKARLAALKYPARRPGLVGTSQGRLGSAGARGRGSGWEMQEAGLVSLSGVQINGRFRSLGAAEPAPGSLKKQESTKKHTGAGRKEIRMAKKIKPRAHPEMWTGMGRGEAGLTCSQGALQPQRGSGGGR